MPEYFTRKQKKERKTLKRKTFNRNLNIFDIFPSALAMWTKKQWSRLLLRDNVGILHISIQCERRKEYWSSSQMNSFLCFSVIVYASEPSRLCKWIWIQRRNKPNAIILATVKCRLFYASSIEIDSIAWTICQADWKQINRWLCAASFFEN